MHVHTETNEAAVVMSPSTTMESHHKLRLWKERCPLQISTAVMNAVTKINLGRRVFTWLVDYRLYHQGKSGQERPPQSSPGAGTEADPQKNTASWFALHSRPSLFINTVQDHILGLAPPTVGESLPISVTHQGNACRLV